VCTSRRQNTCPPQNQNTVTLIIITEFLYSIMYVCCFKIKKKFWEYDLFFISQGSSTDRWRRRLIWRFEDLFPIELSRSLQFAVYSYFFNARPRVIDTHYKLHPRRDEHCNRSALNVTILSHSFILIIYNILFIVQSYCIFCSISFENKILYLRVQN